jgi:hypothetical protein
LLGCRNRFRLVARDTLSFFRWSIDKGGAADIGYVPLSPELSRK